jgi:hypothetical protein
MFSLQYLPEKYHKRWCVAGGYAACPALAKDIDVWVYGLHNDDLEVARAAILAHLEQTVAGLNTKAPIWPEKRYQLENQVETRQFLAYEGLDCRIEKVGAVTPPERLHLLPVHIMVTSAPDPGSLLTGFDVSTHAVAIDHSGRVFKHTNYTHPGEPPFALLHNVHTPDRMARIAARFGHKE